MDWTAAIETNRDRLLDIVIRLFILAGIRTGMAVAALPHGLRLRILAILRPAEYAARRLIAMAACRLVVVQPLPSRRGAKPQNAVILGLEPRTHSVKPDTPKDDEEKVPAFSLFDPFKPFGEPWMRPGGREREPEWPAFFSLPNEPVDAGSICRRIRALEQALQDLEIYAARLARWRARRDRDTRRPRRFSPMRPGLPPGWRRNPKTDVEEVLKECSFLALDAWNTS